MEQKKSRVSDAIPEMPASFDRTVEDTLRSVCTEQNRRASRAFERRPVRLNKKAWIAIAVAATLLITSTAAAAAAIIRHNYHSPNSYMIHDRDEREQTQQAIPDIENAIASAKPETGDYSIRMLPELENADELNGFREAHGQPAFTETDWGWMRDIRPEIEEVLVDGSTIVFNIRLHTDHGMRFGWSGEQSVEGFCEDSFYTVGDDPTQHNLPIGEGGVNPNSVTEDGATLHAGIDIDDLNEPFPTEGTVRVTTNIHLRDNRVESMNDVGLLAILTYTFSFDASAGADAAQPSVTERPLSGSIVLTVYTGHGYENKQVSLDGVVLLETVSYRSTGIYVTYTVQSAPDGWSDAYTQALLEPAFGDAERAGFDLVCAPKGSTDDSENLQLGSPTSIPWDEFTCILPVFPSEYAAVREQGLELRIGYRAIGSFNGEPAGTDWTVEFPAGMGEYDVRAGDLQPLGVFELRLP